MRRSLLVVVSFCVLASTACREQTADTDDDPAPAVDTDAGGSDGDSAEFCGRARSFEEADPTGAVFATEDPAVIEQEWDAFDSLMADLVDTAPPEIAPDFETVAAAFGLLRTAYERAGWDLVAVFDVVETDPELKAAFEGSDPEVEAAGQRIDAYLDEVCATSP